MVLVKTKVRVYDTVIHFTHASYSVRFHWNLCFMQSTLIEKETSIKLRRSTSCQEEVESSYLNLIVTIHHCAKRVTAVCWGLTWSNISVLITTGRTRTAEHCDKAKPTLCEIVAINPEANASRLRTTGKKFVSSEITFHPT